MCELKENLNLRTLNIIFFNSRYAKMWEKGISLTADGCALIYLVDTAGTRTTSDAVNKDIGTDYAWQVFACNSRYGSHYFHEAQAAAQSYSFFTQDDGSKVFEILGFRVSQTQDGMVRWVLMSF